MNDVLSYFFYGMVFWVLLFVFAILNGWFRNKFLLKFGELTAHQLSTITLCGFIFFVTYFFLKISGVTKEYLWHIGFMWMILTVFFEFIFGHFVWKHSWKKLLSDYNIVKGRIWVLVLISLLVAPYIVFFLK